MRLILMAMLLLSACQRTGGYVESNIPGLADRIAKHNLTTLRCTNYSNEGELRLKAERNGNSQRYEYNLQCH